MKKLLLTIIYLLTSGCDFIIPLAATPELSIDARVVGLWERIKTDGKTERLLVLPFNEREYILSWPANTENELLARAHLFDFSGQTLVQLQWIGTSEDTVPDDGLIFQIASYSMRDDTMEIRLLNPVVTGKDFQTPADLAQAVETHLDDPAPFREAMIFHKVQA